MDIPLLIAGLGNPGESYARHRHNVGFMAVQAIFERHRFSPWRTRYRGLTAEGVLNGRKTILLKPMTYMNESGRAVGEAARYLKLPLEAVVVIHDELDLAPGKMKVKAGGGDAGHNGLRSITATLGPDYRRVRIGIGHPGRPAVLAYALHDFSKADREWLIPLLDAVAEAAPRLAADDDPGFMNKVALILKPPKPPTDAKPAKDKKESPPDGI
jgi:peptidyl-tRNA hydrolase, PTH1 family